MAVSRRIVVASLASLTLAGCEDAPDSVEFTRDKRERLLTLRKADKFSAEKSLDYPGADDPDSKAQLSLVINDCLDGVLRQPNGRLDGDVVREQFIGAQKRLDDFSPDDHDRAVEYMVQMWRVLGFKTRTNVLGEPNDQPGAIEALRKLLEQAMEQISGSKQ